MPQDRFIPLMFQPSTIASIAFIAFLAGLSVVLGQITILGLTYLSTFTYQDVVIYSVNGASFIILFWVIASLLGVFVAFPYQQFKELYSNWAQYESIWLRSRSIMSLFSPTSLIAIYVFFESENPKLQVMAAAYASLWCTLAFVTYLFTKETNALIDYIYIPAPFMKGVFDFFFSEFGLFFLLCILFLWSSNKTESQIKTGRYVSLEMSSPSKNQLVRIVSANSKYLVVSQDGELTLISRAKIDSMKFCLDQNSSACLLSEPTPLRVPYLPEAKTWKE